MDTQNYVIGLLLNFLLFYDEWDRLENRLNFLYPTVLHFIGQL